MRCGHSNVPRFLWPLYHMRSLETWHIAVCASMPVLNPRISLEEGSQCLHHHGVHDCMVSLVMCRESAVITPAITTCGPNSVTIHLVHLVVGRELKQSHVDLPAASSNNGRFQGGHRSGFRLPRTVHVRSASLRSLYRMLVPVNEQNRIWLSRWGCAHPGGMRRKDSAI